MTDKKERLVAVIFPHAGGYVARIMPPGITCFSETLDGLEGEIREALDDYSADVDAMVEEAGDFAWPGALAEWEEAVDGTNVFYWDLEERFPH